ncbi:reverse transcriptase domain-containing protein [Tanacetum coccineum]
MRDVYTTLSRFSGKQVNPLGEISLLITVGEAPHHKSEQITFLIVRSDSPNNMLLGRTAIAGLGMIPSMMHSAVLYQSEVRPWVIIRIQRLSQNTNGKIGRAQDSFSCPAAGVPFELKNTGATYQRLVDKVFKIQIGRNMKAYVDDMVINSMDEKDMMADIRETFEWHRKINMKLNQKKCSFGMEEGQFLGNVVLKQGIKSNPTKIQAMTSLKRPKTIKEVQSLNGKLIALNRFLSKSAKKSLPFFKTLKGCLDKKYFTWTREADKAFKEMKRYIEKLC